MDRRRPHDLRPRLAVAAQYIAVGAALAGAVLILGLHDHRHPWLASTTALVALLVAMRAGRAVEHHRRAADALTRSVVAERELSGTLEQNVAARTAELAEAQRILQRMWTLGQQVNLELQPGRVLQRFVEAVVDVVQADGGVLGLAADDAQIRIAAATGIGEPWLGRTMPVAGSAMGQAMRSGGAWCETDLAARPELSAASPSLRADPRGIAVVPLQRRGELVGAIAVVSSRPRRFSPIEVSRIESMTDMLSVALSNAELVENLRQAEWRFRTLFRAAPDAVLTIFQSGRIREANDALRDITGFDPVQLVGRTLGDLVVDEDRDRLNAAVAAAFGGRAGRLEVLIRRPNGTRVLAIAASRLPEADPPTVLIIGRDITAEREMRARLLETERLAAVGELVAGVAHEVNNPLSSISAFAQLLVRDGGLTPGQAESVEVIRSEAFRASQVVKDLLAFARRSDPHREPVDLNRVVERSLRLRGYQLQETHVVVEHELEPDLPAVVGDARQLQQVVLNLVTNAIQAMATTGGTLRVATRAAAGRIVLTVTDTGPGIHPSVRPHVFEPFVTTKPEGEGTGLGLSVSYGIVTAHGGAIEVVETGSAGTAIEVALPALEQPVAAGPSGEAPPWARSPLSGTRLLFVDDERALRSGMEAFGRLRGFSVVTAGDGNEALSAVGTTGFDAIVCDLRMPGMDGLTFHDTLRRERPGLAARTVFITGDMMSVAGRVGTTARQPILMKPFTFERLEETVAAVMRGLPSARHTSERAAVAD